MNKVPIPRSPLDIKFREVCTNLINSANKSVYVIAGELGSLLFPDMQNATANAVSQRKVIGYAYATERAPINHQNLAISIGCKLYIGKDELPEHYLVIDRKDFVKSIGKVKGKVTGLGTREGEVHYDDPEGSEEIIRKFEDLKSRAKEITALDKKTDPYYRFLYNQ